MGGGLNPPNLPSAYAPATIFITSSASSSTHPYCIRQSCFQRGCPYDLEQATSQRYPCKQSASFLFETQDSAVHCCLQRWVVTVTQQAPPFLILGFMALYQSAFNLILTSSSSSFIRHNKVRDIKLNETHSWQDIPGSQSSYSSL